MTASATKSTATPSSSPVAAPQTTPSPPAAEAGLVIAPVPMTTAPTLVSRSASDSSSVAGAKWRDGIYTGRGDSPHGGIDVRVVIKDGRIVEAGILGCYTRYPCEEIDSVLHQPVERQSPNVDYVSHATESSDAYYYGLVEALKAALYQPPGNAADSP